MAEISFDQFSRKMLAAADGIEKAEPRIVGVGGQALATAVTQIYRGATGGDGRLSGTGAQRRARGASAQRGGSGKEALIAAKLKDVRRYSGGSVGLVVPTGPWALIERDTPEHLIAPFSFSASAVKRGKAKVRKAMMLTPSGRRSRRAGPVNDAAVFAARLAVAQMATAQGRAVRGAGTKTGYAAYVTHPGTKGRAVFSSGCRAAGPKVAKTMGEETVRQMVDGYRGRG